MRLMVLVLAALVSSAVWANDNDKVKAFFDKSKIGNSADYGIFKNDTEHTISIHGFDNDLDVCLEVISVLNAKEKEKKYTCKPLNH